MPLNGARKILFVSHCYPPSSEVGAIRVARLSQYLPEFGLQPVVLTSETIEAEASENIDLVPAGIQIERAVQFSSPLELYAATRNRFREKSSNGQASASSKDASINRPSLRVYLLHLLTMPDGDWGWYWPAVRLGKKLIERESIAAIFSSGPPWTSHMVACRLKSLAGIPWIADYRDSWTFDTWRLRWTPGWRLRLDRWMEKRWLANADLVTCTTDAIRDGFISEYPPLPKSKFATLTNGFDDVEVVQPDSITKPAKKTLVHSGTLYGDRYRCLESFCQAVGHLVDTGSLDPTMLKILFLGETSPAAIAIAERTVPKLLKEKSIEFRPRVPWQEAQQIVRLADLLLIFQGDHKLSIPAKFYEYLRTGKPMLAIAEKGALSELLDRTRSGLHVDPAQPDKVASVLLNSLTLPRLSPQQLESLAGEFHFKNLAKRLARWFQGLIGDPPDSAAEVVDENFRRGPRQVR